MSDEISSGTLMLVQANASKKVPYVFMFMDYGTSSLLTAGLRSSLLLLINPFSLCMYMTSWESKFSEAQFYSVSLFTMSPDSKDCARRK